MSLFGRRRNFGFSGGLGDALARPAYTEALGAVGMLAGSMDQRQKAQDKQNERMQLLQTADPQAIINYSLTEARRLNDPKLLVAAQGAQKRMVAQGNQQKVTSLLTTYADPTKSTAERQAILTRARALQADPATSMSPSALNSLVSSANAQYNNAYSTMARNAFNAGEGSEQRSEFLRIHGATGESDLRSIQASNQRDQNVIDTADKNAVKTRDESQVEALLVEMKQLTSTPASIEEHKERIAQIETDLVGLGEASPNVDASRFVGLGNRLITETYSAVRESEKLAREQDDRRQDAALDQLVEQFVNNRERLSPAQFMEIIRLENKKEGGANLDQEHLSTLNERLGDVDEERQSGVALFKEGKLTDSRRQWLEKNPTFDLTEKLEQVGGSVITDSFEKALAEFRNKETPPRRKILLGGYITDAIDLGRKEQEAVRRSDGYRSTAIERTLSDYMDMADPEKLGYQPGRVLKNQEYYLGLPFGSPAMYDIVFQMRDGRHADDYKKLQKQLDLQLQMNPDAANDPEVFIGEAFKKLKFFEKYVSGQDVVNEQDEDLEIVRAQIEAEKDALVDDHNQQFPDNKISREDVTEADAYLSLQEQSARRLAQEQADVAANIRRVREMASNSRGENPLRRPSRSQYFAENPSERTAGVRTAVGAAMTPIIELGQAPERIMDRMEKAEERNRNRNGMLTGNNQ